MDSLHNRSFTLVDCDQQFSQFLHLLLQELQGQNRRVLANEEEAKKTWETQHCKHDAGYINFMIGNKDPQKI